MFLTHRLAKSRKLRKRPSSRAARSSDRRTYWPSKTTSAASTSHIWAALAQIFSRSSVAAFLAARPVTYVPELAYEPASNGDTSVSTPRTTISELSTPSSSAAICARMVSTPMPLSVAPVEIVMKPSSSRRMSMPAISTLEMPEPCMVSAQPRARTRSPRSTASGLSRQPIMSIARSRQRSSAQALSFSL